MRTGRGVLAACCTVLALAPWAHASQGTDSITRGDHIGYYGDPGEANRLTIDALPGGLGLHLSDSGAIIRWFSVPLLSSCQGGVHDVFCTSTGALYGSLADGDDTYTDNVGINAELDLGSGNNATHVVDNGPDQPYVSFTAGTGADDIHGGGSLDDEFSYATSPGAVTVSADGVANDGMPGEGDNIHSDIELVRGSAFDDRLSGFLKMGGGAGNDVLVAGPQASDLAGGDGDDVIDARNGAVDQISCGAGDDTVQADPQDVIAPDCEHVSTS